MANYEGRTPLPFAELVPLVLALTGLMWSFDGYREAVTNLIAAKEQSADYLYRYVRVDERAIDRFAYNPATGDISQFQPYAAQPARSKVMGVNYALHTGRFGGIWAKILLFFASLIGALLTITGYWLWWSRRTRYLVKRMQTDVAITQKLGYDFRFPFCGRIFFMSLPECKKRSPLIRLLCLSPQFTKNMKIFRLRNYG